MNNYQKFKHAVDNDLLVIAHVSLYNGQQRVRLGPVANLNRTHVTINEIGKGFRTTPLGLVHSVNYGGKFQYNQGGNQ